MIQAGGEYIYIVLIGAYYLYQAYASSQKKKKEAMNGGKPPKSKPKGSFLEEILKEIEEKQEQMNLPKPKSQPKPQSQPQHQFPVEKAKDKRVSETKRRPMESQMTLDRFEKTESTMLRNTTIKGTLDLDNFDSIEYDNSRASDTVRNEITDAPVKSAPKKIKILGRQITAKEAFIGQLILERKV